jgi:hypothetical protein
MPPRKRKRSGAATTKNFASPPNRGTSRVSARLQSLYTGDKRDECVDFVRACREFKARKWVKAARTFGGPGPQAFTVPRWQPVGPASAELAAIRDRPPPSIKRSKRRRLEEARANASSPRPSSGDGESSDRRPATPADLMAELEGAVKDRASAPDPGAPPEAAAVAPAPAARGAPPREDVPFDGATPPPPPP